MRTVFLSLGSNLGDSKALIASAIEHIRQMANTLCIQTAPLYITAPISAISQNDFLNTALELSTSLSPQRLLKKLQTIEKYHGRLPCKQKNAPRYLDIDILFYGKKFICERNLYIPHPRWSQRLFVLKPLSDLTDTVYDPISGIEIPIQPLVEQCMHQRVTLL